MGRRLHAECGGTELRASGYRLLCTITSRDYVRFSRTSFSGAASDMKCTRYLAPQVPLSGTLKPEDLRQSVRPSGVAEPLRQLQRLGEDPRGLFTFPNVPRGLGRLD